MKLVPLNTLAMLGVRHGYNRPLDRHDFDGTPRTNPIGNRGHIPQWAHEYVPGMGELKRFSNLGLLSGDDASGQDMFNTNITKTTVQYHPLGSIAVSRDGRVFRYSSAGATDLVVGNVIQSPAPIPNHLALTAAVQSVGDGTPIGNKPIVVTPGATAGAANLYAEGTLQVSVTPDLGHTYRVNSHPAITASTAFNLYLDPDDLVQIAFTTATRYGLLHNPWKTTIVAPTTLTAGLCGVANTIITGNGTAENYGWLQTRGPASVLINGTPGVGVYVMNSATTAGAVDVITTTNLVTSNLVGRMMQVGVSTKNNSVFLLID